MAQTQPVHWTYADFCRLPDDGKRYEIIEGVLHVSPSPNRAHQGCLGLLYLLIAGWVARTAGGKVYFAPLDVILADDTVVEPDLIWISPQRRAIMSDRGLEAAPDLAVEVLSPSTKSRDRTLKGRIYLQYGVREYWLMDPVRREVVMQVPGPDGYRVHARGTGPVHLVSSLDPSLVVIPSGLFESE